MTDDLVQFLRARLDEDQALARKAAGRKQGGESWTFGDVSVRAGDGSLVLRHTWADEGAHIVHHDPARVLRDVEAKRQLLDVYLLEAAGADEQINDEWRAGSTLAYDLLCIMALAYSDHPDYRREEWRL